MTIILNMRNKLLELPNAIPYSSVNNITASMLLEYTECFPNMNVDVLGVNGPYSGSIRSIRKPFGVFGNHTENIRKANGKHSVIH
jgi:hypothetical protein